MSDIIEIMLAQLELKLDSIKIAITSCATQKEKNHRVMNLANLALDISKEIKNELEGLLTNKNGEGV